MLLFDLRRREKNDSVAPFLAPVVLEPHLLVPGAWVWRYLSSVHFKRGKASGTQIALGIPGARLHSLERFC